MRKVIESIKRVFFKEGLLYIFGSGCLSQICSLLSSIIVIRGLSKIEYGGYVQANNLYSYVAIFVGMGFVSGIMQFCSEPIQEEKKVAIYKYTLIKGALFNILLLFALALMAYIENAIGKEVAARYLIYMLGYPFALYISNYFQMVLRIKRKNKEYAYVNIAYSIVLLLSNIILTRVYGVLGLILSYYIAYLISIVIGIFYCNREQFLKNVWNSNAELSNKRDIDRYSLSCAVTNFAYGILLLIDVTIIDVVISDTEILADYKVASSIPAALGFVSSCLMTFYYPQIVEVYYSRNGAFKTLLTKLIFVFSGVNLFILLIGEIGASFIIGSLYGNQYISAVPLFRILLVNFFISSTIRRIMGNLIVIIKKIRVNFYHCIIAGVLNIVLDCILIRNMGSLGAAIATTICTVVMAILEIRYIYKYMHKENYGVIKKNEDENFSA